MQLHENATSTQQETRMSLILCDFDGTLTKRDTLALFLRYAGGMRFYFYLPFFCIIMLFYKCRLLSAQSAKEYFFSLLFKGYIQEKLEKLGHNFAQHILNSKEIYFRRNALEFLQSEKEKKLRIFIVSASPEIWIMPFANALGFEYIATRFEYKNNKFTGKFLGKNCNGKEKMKRIISEINDVSSYYIKAYGDTKGDLAMFEMADEPYFKFFHERN